MYITTHFVHRLFASSLLDDKTTLNVIFLKPVNSKKEYIQKIFKIKRFFHRESHPLNKNCGYFI